MANMNQNKYYTQLPTVVYNRSRFDLSHHHKGSTNLGEIRPFLLREILPGDTFDVKSNFQVRLTNALNRPLMDNMFIDFYYFFVPNRLVYDKWEQVMGDNSESAWIPQSTYKFPTTEEPSNVVKSTLADSFGLPQGLVPKGLQVAPFRAYALIYNEWFRDQNVVDPTFVQKGEIGINEKINSMQYSVNNYMGMPAKASKLHDRFTSAVPDPQKGEPVTVRLDTNTFLLDTAMNPYEFQSGNNLAFAYDMGNIVTGNYNFALGSNITYTAGSGNPIADVQLIDSAESANTSTGVQGTNLVVNTENVGITVNDLRLAFATQRMLEKDATYGTRYREILRAHWGVISPDSRLQIPEFLGGKRVQLDVGEVWQTSGNEHTTAAGNDNVLASSAAYSKTNGNAGFSKAFVENGYLIGVYCIRQHHTYAQGIEPMWRKSERLDFYDPTFANIGFQPIYTSELYGLIGDDQTATEVGLKDNVFGYSEAWYDYRTAVNHVTGYLAPTGDYTGLETFTLADLYDGAPVLSQEFIEEIPQYLDRALAVQSNVYHQFILDIYNQISAIRVMPSYSTPSALGGEHR